MAFLAAMGLLGGILAAWIFWLIRRPDRDAPPRLDASAKPPDPCSP